MSLFFYHYTSEKAYNAMTRNGASPADGNPFICKTNQPQKWLEFDKQHPSGFYVTCLTPDQMDATTKRKVGGSAKDGAYVLVFELNVREKDFKGSAKSKASDLPRAVNANIAWVGSPCKYVINNTGKDKALDTITFSTLQCVWAGEADSLPRDCQNDDKVCARLKNP